MLDFILDFLWEPGDVDIGWGIRIGDKVDEFHFFDGIGWMFGIVAHDAEELAFIDFWLGFLEWDFEEAADIIFFGVWISVVEVEEIWVDVGHVTDFAKGAFVEDGS